MNDAGKKGPARGDEERERERRERYERLLLIGRYQYYFTIPFKHAWLLPGRWPDSAAPPPACISLVGLLPWVRGRAPAPNQEEQWLQSFFDETLAAYMVWCSWDACKEMGSFFPKSLALLLWKVPILLFCFFSFDKRGIWACMHGLTNPTFPFLIFF